MYIANMHKLEVSDPCIWEEFVKGNFCVKKSTIAFTSIGVDHAIEHVNRSMKVMGGIRGLTQKPDALNRFFLISPELARLSKEAEIMADCTTQVRTHHHDLSPISYECHERRIEKLKAVVRESNPFEFSGAMLMNFITKSIVPEEVTRDIMRSLTAGEDAYKQFVIERIIDDVNLFEKMSKIKLKTWSSSTKTCKVKIGKETIEF